MATNDKRFKSGKEFETKVMQTLKVDLNHLSGLEQRCPIITIEDSARMNAAGIRSHVKLNHILDEREPVDYEKLKSHAKKNHLKLRDMKNENFEHTSLKLKPSPTLLSLETSSAISTNSSGSSNEGVLTGWMLSWCLDSKNSRLSDTSSSSKRHSHTHGAIESRLTIKGVKGGCFLRRDSSVVVTEPQANRLRVFSRKRGNLLATVDGKEWLQRNCVDGDEAWNRFCPSAVCETETDNVLAVTDRSKLYKVRIAGFESVIEDEIKLKNRIDLLGVAYTNQSKMILLDSGRTNKPFVGCYDSSGNIIREFRGNFSKPSYVAWNDYYQVAAIVDCGHRNVSFYDIDSKLIANFISPPNKINNIGTNDNSNHLSWPSGISWTSHSQLLIADKASNRVLSFDFRAMKSENALDFIDGLKEPVVLACDQMSKTLMVTEEEYLCGGKDSFRLKTFRRHGVPKTVNEGLFF